jgi:hypothetical protein
VVPPPQGAVVSTPPASCSTVYVGTAPNLDCGGAFYATVPSAYQVIPPPVGATVTTLPSGAVDQNINGTTYFTFGGVLSAILQRQQLDLPSSRETNLSRYENNGRDRGPCDAGEELL